MFERTKIINGREYRYLVRNERIGKTVRQKVVKYLGPTEPVYKKRKELESRMRGCLQEKSLKERRRN